MRKRQRSLQRWRSSWSQRPEMLLQRHRNQQRELRPRQTLRQQPFLELQAQRQRRRL